MSEEDVTERVKEIDEELSNLDLNSVDGREKVLEYAKELRDMILEESTEENNYDSMEECIDYHLDEGFDEDQAFAMCADKLALSEEESDVYEEAEDAVARSEELGCKGIHSHTNDEGDTVFMPCATHEDYEERLNGDEESNEMSEDDKKLKTTKLDPTEVHTADDK